MTCEGPVVDVRFAPTAFGLKLACCTVEGKARVYSCTSMLDMKLWDFEDIEEKGLMKDQREAKTNYAELDAQGDAMEMSAALDWMPTPFGGPNEQGRGETIAIARGKRLCIWTKDHKGKWVYAAGDDRPSSQRDGGIKDVAWCPNMCRQSEIIATCGAGAKLWQLEMQEAVSRQQWRLQELKVLVPPDSPDCPVWRCSWNLTGTSLALCPEGYQMSVWKQDRNLVWQQETRLDIEEDQA